MNIEIKFEVRQCGRWFFGWFWQCLSIKILIISLIGFGSEVGFVVVALDEILVVLSFSFLLRKLGKVLLDVQESLQLGEMIQLPEVLFAEIDDGLEGQVVEVVQGLQALLINELDQSVDEYLLQIKQLFKVVLAEGQGGIHVDVGGLGEDLLGYASIPDFLLLFLVLS